jgi:hypothetical protein
MSSRSRAASRGQRSVAEPQAAPERIVVSVGDGSPIGNLLGHVMGEQAAPGDDVHVDWHMTQQEWSQLSDVLTVHHQVPYIEALIAEGKLPPPARVDDGGAGSDAAAAAAWATDFRRRNQQEPEPFEAAEERVRDHFKAVAHSAVAAQRMRLWAVNDRQRVLLADQQADCGNHRRRLHDYGALIDEMLADVERAVPAWAQNGKTVRWRQRAGDDR